MPDEPKCQCYVTFEPDAKPIVHRDDCRLHGPASRPTQGLDAAIREQIRERQDGVYGVQDFADALLAVLDLHQPGDEEQVEPDGGAVWGKVCVECGSDALGSWPCPTVRAIAEKLGVSLTG